MAPLALPLAEAGFFFWILSLSLGSWSASFLSEMLIRARLLDAPSFGVLRYVADGGVALDPASGQIAAIGPWAEVVREFAHLPTLQAPEGEDWLLVPGLIDTHAHLPQYPAVARRESSLLPWLKNHVFPLEAKFRGEAQRAFVRDFFEEVLANGSTTVVLYSAIWAETTELAFEVAEEKGLRAIIGKVMMDEGSYGDADPWQARALSLAQCRELIERWHGAAGGLLEFAVSPRFAVTCSRELMREAGALAREFGTYVQTHLSENEGEIEAVRARFPEAASYAAVYEQAGLLSPKTLLGHCLHLSPEEIALLAARGARVTHCPTSNFFLNSGLFPLGALRAAGIPVSLGSDVAGGPELNLWQVMRSAIEMQKARAFQEAGVAELTPAEAFYFATAGGAAVLGKEGQIGLLEAGKEADLLLLDLNRVFPLGGRYSVPEISAEQIVTACVYRGHPSATVASWVRARRVR